MRGCVSVWAGLLRAPPSASKGSFYRVAVPLTIGPPHSASHPLRPYLSFISLPSFASLFSRPLVPIFMPLASLHFAMIPCTPRFLPSFAPPIPGPQPLSLCLLISNDLLEKIVEGHTPSCECGPWSREDTVSLHEHL